MSELIYCMLQNVKPVGPTIGKFEDRDISESLSLGPHISVVGLASRTMRGNLDPDALKPGEFILKIHYRTLVWRFFYAHFSCRILRWRFRRIFCGAVSAADEAAKEAFNNNCRTCHSWKKDDNRLGPNLGGIVGRKAGSVAGFAYSGSMKNSGVTWDESSLDKSSALPTALSRTAR